MNWREGYQEQIREHVSQMRRERALGDWRLYTVPGVLRMVPARNLRDSWLQPAARLLAEQDANRAIREHSPR